MEKREEILRWARWFYKAYEAEESKRRLKEAFEKEFGFSPDKVTVTTAEAEIELTQGNAFELLKDVIGFYRSEEPTRITIKFVVKTTRDKESHDWQLVGLFGAKAEKVADGLKYTVDVQDWYEDVDC